jgi:hypothetical protein
LLKRGFAMRYLGVGVWSLGIEAEHAIAQERLRDEVPRGWGVESRD